MIISYFKIYKLWISLIKREIWLKVGHEIQNKTVIMVAALLFLFSFEFLPKIHTGLIESITFTHWNPVGLISIVTYFFLSLTLLFWFREFFVQYESYLSFERSWPLPRVLFYCIQFSTALSIHLPIFMILLISWFFSLVIKDTRELGVKSLAIFPFFILVSVLSTFLFMTLNGMRRSLMHSGSPLLPLLRNYPRSTWVGIQIYQMISKNRLKCAIALIVFLITLSSVSVATQVEDQSRITMVSVIGLSIVSYFLNGGFRSVLQLNSRFSTMFGTMPSRVFLYSYSEFVASTILYTVPIIFIIHSLVVRSSSSYGVILIEIPLIYLLHFLGLKVEFTYPRAAIISNLIATSLVCLILKGVLA